jgi:uncharacterized repeat protein (TIGR04076 family)
MNDEEYKAKMERRWKRFQEAMGYTDKEIEAYRADPMKVKAMERAPKFGTYDIIAECVQSRNCNAGHKVGDKIIFDGNGVILRDLCPPRMCFGVIQVIAPCIYAIWERFADDLEDVCIMLPLVHCPDVGVENGGWGETIWRVYAEPKKR